MSLINEIDGYVGKNFDITLNEYRYVNIGGKSLYIEGHKGIQLLSNEEITFKLKKEDYFYKRARSFCKIYRQQYCRNFWNNCAGKCAMKSKVTLQVSGVNLDKLYTKLSNKCVIQNMKRLDHKTLKLKLDYDDYIQNKELFKAFEVEQQKISGNKLFKLFFNKYCIFFICVPICLMLFIFSTCFVWQIKIYGVDNEIKSNIVKILNEKNVKNGSFFAHNTEVLEQSVLNEIDKIAQLSIIKRGSTIIVNASEKLTYLQTSFEPITAKKFWNCNSN